MLIANVIVFTALFLYVSHRKDGEVDPYALVFKLVMLAMAIINFTNLK